MFDRFTDEARRVVVLAQEEARSLEHDYIGTEHLLLGMLQAGTGSGAAVLRSLGVSCDDARATVIEIVGRGGAEPADAIPFTPRAKKVLELSLRESLKLDHHEISDAHILLALLRETAGVAARALARLDVDAVAVRTAVLREFGGPGDAPAMGRRRLFRRSAPPPGHEEAPLVEHVSALEFFDDTGWDAVARARSTARERRAGVVTCRDLLAGVAAVAGPGADCLRAAGADPEALRATGGPPAGAKPSPSPLFFDGAARVVLARAVEEARRRDDAEATTAHLLLGLVGEHTDDVAAALDEHDVALPDLREQIARRLDAPET
jgi:ATP-dependent Clp protease ATP-binding subunit ClpA